LQSDKPRADGPAQPSDQLARRNTADGRNLLDRILNTPHLEQVVPRLPPDLLHGIIHSCGLEDCGEIVALATPEQLAHVFDLDLWRAAQPGIDEQFDADRFGVWLEVLVEAGAAVAAQKLAAMDIDLVIAGLAQHALVYDRAAVTPYQTTDGEQVEPTRPIDRGPAFDISGYLLVARRADSWDAIVQVLVFLEEGHPDYFHQVMRGCRTLSNSGREIDGLDDLLPDGDQVMLDVAVDREERREKQGHVMPAQARAFLQMSREFTPDAMPAANPLVRAYFRAIDEAAGAYTQSVASPSGLLAVGSEAQQGHDDSAKAVAAVFEVLSDAGIIAQPPRALLSGSEARAPRLGHIQARLEFLLDENHDVYLARDEEIAYLANTLMAGCSIQARPFTARESSDAVVSICNLGLENWPPQWLSADATAPAISVLVEHDLVSVFQVGWAVLHNDVCMYAAEQLIKVLDSLRWDDSETQMGLDALRIQMAKHWNAGAPWRARDSLEVIAILDMPAWAVLLALIDECPVLHAGIAASRNPRTLSFSMSEFEFISENSQIAAVHEFMQLLPETLRR
jgi:hypothetical protein